MFGGNPAAVSPWKLACSQFAKENYRGKAYTLEEKGGAEQRIRFAGTAQVPDAGR
jgi:hypothetical protein